MIDAATILFARRRSTLAVWAADRVWSSSMPPDMVRGTLFLLTTCRKTSSG